MPFHSEKFRTDEEKNNIITFMNKNILRIMVLAFVCFAAVSFAGVLYRIDGIMTINDGKVYFQAANASIYLLEVKLSTAKKYEGQTVQIDAIGKDATTVSTLKVKNIRPFAKKIEAKGEGNFKAYQKPARMLLNEDGIIKMAGVRCGRKTGTDNANPEFNWRTVTMIPDMIKEVYLIKKPFPPEWIAAHCLMFFQFEKGGCIDQNGNQMAGVVLSIEAFQRESQSYSLVKGFQNEFGIIWILTSWRDYVLESCKYTDYKLVPYKVLFDHEQKKGLLAEAMKQSGVNRDGEMYHTTRNNCTNNLVILMDKLTEKKIRFWTLPSMIYNVRATMPTMVPSYLYKKGLLSEAFKTIDKSNYEKYLGDK